MKSIIIKKFGENIFDIILEKSKGVKTDAMFQGGEKKFSEFLSNNFNISKFKKDSTTIRLVVSVVIDSIGKPIEIKISRGVTSEIDNEVLRILERMPNWIPATLNGYPVKRHYNIPITIKNNC